MNGEKRLSAPMPKLCVALDVDLDAARRLLGELSDLPLVFKVGPGALLEGGLSLPHMIKELGRELFLDLKLHDIPNTVSLAVQRAEELGADYLTLHTIGGYEMLRAAVSVRRRTKLIGVTLLTSHGGNLLRLLKMNFQDPAEVVVHLARLAQSTGLDGVVCSAAEVRRVKEETSLITVVPGVRISERRDDQVRVSTPQFAVREGADVIVMGRDVYRSDNPRRTVERLLEVLGEEGASEGAF